MSASRTDTLVIARRYATAIFAQAAAEGKQPVVASELATLAAAIAGDSALAEALSNPLITRAQKAAVLEALVAKGSPITKRAVGVIARGGRAAVIPQISEVLAALLAAERGELVAEVTSARPLNDQTRSQLEKSLAKATGKAVQLRFQQNPDLLGGLIVQLGSLRLDATLAGALNTMQTHMKAAAGTTF